jgi:adenylate cyclase
MAEGSGFNRGETTRSTILFADLRGFTTLAEDAPPAEVMSTLNECFSGVVPVASRHGGVVSKFDGDAIMVFFGILPRPLPPQVSALQACHAAMEMMTFIKDLNRSRSLRNQPELSMGIGIATGSVIAGGLGTPDRLHYTVIGDAVNIAQRLQQITSELGAPSVLISEETYTSLGSAQAQFVFGRRGTAQLKGKAKQVTVHELRDRKAKLVED